MATFWESLTDRGKVNWTELYKQLTGREWQKPSRDERAIICEPKLESLDEIDKLMRKPGRGAWHE